MTETSYRSSWGSLACAVLERAFGDLENSNAGFSSCSLTERAKWRKDARLFFESKGYRLFADCAGLQWTDVERAFQLRCPPPAENRKRRKKHA
jgi:hypothetical protein